MDFPLPPVGEGLIEVELVRWLVKPGDAVLRGQSLVEVMSDKATMEVPAPFAGTVTALGAAPGTKVKVGQVILSYTPVGEETSVATASGQSPVAEAAGVPISGSSSEKAVGVAATVRGANTPSPATAYANGVRRPLLPPAAPSVRQLARKLGVDLAKVRGSGPHGRILLDDLTPYLASAVSGGPTAPSSATRIDTSKLDVGVAGTRVKLLGMRRTIAEHMIAAKRHIPHYSYIDEVDISDLVRLRAQLRDPLAATGVKLTYLAFFVRAVAWALKEVPMVNSSLDEAAGEIVLHDRYHIGVAVATSHGLIVPVVKDADKKDIVAIAAEIDRLSAEAKAGKSRLEDLRGGTFTVTSVGGIGGLISTPIINYPEVGIMGVGKVVKRPIYDANGALKPADIVYLSFSFDHRIVDGAVGAAFGNAVIRYLQVPGLLLLPEPSGGQ